MKSYLETSLSRFRQAEREQAARNRVIAIGIVICLVGIELALSTI